MKNNDNFLDEYLKDEKIDDDKHFIIIGDFTCEENKSLEIFLKCHAIRYNELEQGTTYIVRDEDEVLAFYTLKCNAIQMEDIEEDNDMISVPSIEIARLAVKSGEQAKGWGVAIFSSYIFPKIMQIKEIVAVKFIQVFVERDDKVAIKFYEKLGFTLASKDVQNHIKESYSDRCEIMLANFNEVQKRIKESRRRSPRWSLS